MDNAIGDFDGDEGALKLPSLVAGSPRVDMQEPEFWVRHYLEDVAVAADEQVDAFFFQYLFHPGRVAAWRTAYVCHPYFHSLAVKFQKLGTFPVNKAVVDVSSYGPDNVADFFELADDCDVAHVAGVPNLVAIGEMTGETRVKARMGVREDSYFHGCRTAVMIVREAPRQGTAPWNCL